MKRVIAGILLVSMVIVMVGCGQRPSITASDYEAELNSFSEHLDYAELSEISCRLLGIKKSKFDDLLEWRRTTGAIGAPSLIKEFQMGGRIFEVDLDLEDDCVARVNYKNSNATLEDLNYMVSFFSMSESGINQVETTFDVIILVGEDSERISGISYDEMLETLLCAEKMGNSWIVGAKWEYVNEKGVTYIVQYTSLVTSLDLAKYHAEDPDLPHFATLSYCIED